MKPIPMLRGAGQTCSIAGKEPLLSKPLMELPNHEAQMVKDKGDCMA